MTGKFLPDKAIDAIDEAGARSRMESMKRPQEIEDLSDEIKEICALKESAISNQNFEEVQKLGIKRKNACKRKRVLESWKKNRRTNRAEVNEDDMLRYCRLDWYSLNRMESKKVRNYLNWRRNYANR